MGRRRGEDRSEPPDEGGFSGRYTMIRRRAAHAEPPPDDPPPSTPSAAVTAPVPAAEPEPAAPPPAEPAPTEQAPPTPEAPAIHVSAHTLPGALDEDLVVLAAPDSPRAASYRVLRHDLAERTRSRVFAVTSPRAGEGKTTCAANLALALSECGRARVLLIEANLSTPRLASLFGFRPPWCFAEQLGAHRDDPRLPWSTVAVIQPWLQVLAVRPDAPARQLVDTVAWSMALTHLRRVDYDFVVVDAPRVLGTAEANLVQDAVDGMVLVTRTRRSRSRDLRRAIDQLGPGKIVGVVHLQ